MIKLSSLRPYPNNPRKISDNALEKLKESIQRDPEYMIARPIVIDQESRILGGNQRHKACKALGMKEVPEEWVRRVEWDGEKAKRFNVIDNLQMGEFDLELLSLDWETEELLDLGFELGDLGINDASPLDDMPALPDGDREPFQQMTFTLHDEQVEQVKAAIERAKSMGSFDSPNENSNGNALARVCEIFLTSHAHS